MTSKTCTKCGEVKDLAEFHKSTRSKDGRRSECRPCRVLPKEPRPPRTYDKCPVPECTGMGDRAGYCYPHYMKQYRYGTPTPTHRPQWRDIRGHRFGTLTVTTERDGRFWICICDCGETARRTVDGLEKYGDGSNCGVTGKHYVTDQPTYSGAHQRVVAIRGSASTHDCIDCGKTAAHWSYDHGDPDELHYEYKPGMFAAYSARPEHYFARCVRCHKRMDLDRIHTAQLTTTTDKDN